MTMPADRLTAETARMPGDTSATRAVTAWAVIPTLQSKISWRTYPTRKEARERAVVLKKKLGFRACRIAKVRISEITQEASDAG